MPTTAPAEKTSFSLSRDSFGQLVLQDADGVRHAGVEPVRGFPLSQRDQFVTLLNDQGREVLMIENMTVLPPPMRQMLEDEMSRREFVPEIKRIVSATLNVDPSLWHVETDRGPTSFSINSEDDIRRIAPNCYLILDTAGGRYIIRDLRKLDSLGRKLLDKYM